MGKTAMVVGHEKKGCAILRILQEYARVWGGVIERTTYEMTNRQIANRFRCLWRQHVLLKEEAARSALEGIAEVHALVRQCVTCQS
jgi:hypothetical protein